MRVGLLIGTYSNSYTLGAVKWISEELKDRNCTMVVLEGLSLGRNTISDYACNTIFRLITKSRIDALIILSSELAVQAGKPIVEDLAHRVGIPVVSLGLELEGIPSVLADNSSGFEKIVSHLVFHGYKRIAHISGPLYNTESLLRRDAFMKVIYQNGLELPKHHLLEGNFEYSSGYSLTKHLIEDIRQKKIEAIVCANDHMAYGAVKCLNENGVQVPRDVAVTGFDDSSMSRFFNPPITTVAQTFDAMCQKAVSLLFDLRHKKQTDLVYTFEPELVIRISCGCIETPKQSKDFYHVLPASAHRLNGRLQSLETEGFFSALSDQLTENGVNHCYIVTYTDYVRLDDHNAVRQALKANLFFGYANGKRVFHTLPFEASMLLPDQLFETLDDPFIIKPLFFDKIQFGYAVVSANENASYFIDDLGPEISHYLESIYLDQEREMAQKKLSETLESLVLTNRKLNALTVKENLDRLNNLRQLAANMLQSRKAGNGDYYLILVEIDNFYEINNEYGFTEGENLVNTVSQLLAGSIRDDDFLSHQSCERYVILVKNVQGEAMEAIEKRFRAKLAACNESHERPFTVSMTWGYASAKIDSDFDAIYQEAEADLMKKKYQKFLTLEQS